MASRICLRRFLFHTALGSGAEPAFPPLAMDDLETRPLPTLATNLGRGVEVPVDGVEERPGAVVAGFSASFAGAVGGVPFVVRKVLLTLMDLKEIGFLTAEAARA